MLARKCFGAPGYPGSMNVNELALQVVWIWITSSRVFIYIYICMYLCMIYLYIYNVASNAGFEDRLQVASFSSEFRG